MLTVNRSIRIGILAAALASPLAAPGASAATFKFASPVDAYTLDPHAVSNTLVFAILGNIYEPLVRRGGDLQLEPALATKWTLVDNSTWRFELRKGVKFQDGGDFTADDVVFSFERAKAGGIKSNLSTLESVKKVDDYTIDIKTRGVDPIVPMEITNWFIMSKAWSEKNGAVQPGSPDNKVETFANRNAMGTGPFKLAGRDPGVKIEFEKNPAWWDKPVGNIDKATFFVIPNPSARVSALVSGEVDMIDTLPPQDTQRIEQTKGLKVLAGPDLRVAFLLADVNRDELLYSDVKGKNPFKDKRVREAMQLAIDLDAIKTKVMRNYSKPLGLAIAPEVNGFDPELGKPVQPDVAKAKALLTEAGYPNGFSVTFDCTNDRFMNDEATCIAISGSLGRIGIKAEPRAQTTSKWAQQINPPGYNTSLTMVGYSPFTYDAHIFLTSLLHSRDAAGRGVFNIGGYSNPKVDELIAQIQSDTNPDSRRQKIREALKIAKDDVALIPIHQLNILWAAKDTVNVVQPADLAYPLRLFSVKQ
ncbi:ABC transporter substrate-binding protein [Alsobacter sp. SYSU M60028]|uniref:ABC transporter substrate-binding protein n=1 Tax=Alsobacter ponti TaxID=2962936 RepID=A0ABT1LAK0_9HYPH|nr:ABC transporter substrate-binding protein [Alsobacter ponti]MCP8938469.1 ABC transporter substrate-binding protein [Alsobacter ponti]